MKPRFTFFIIILFLLCNFSAIFAQSNCDSLLMNGPFVRHLIGQPFFLNVKEEEDSYRDYSPVIIPEYFLLGVFHENRGGVFSEVGSFDTFYGFQKEMVEFLKDYIQQNFNIQISIKDPESGIYEVSSGEVALMLNKYLNIIGELNMRMVDSEEKLYSYLSGVYYRSGFRIGEKLYAIYNHNEDNVYTFLKDAKCKNILYLSIMRDNPNEYKNYHDNPYMFCFEPSVYLRKYLDMYKQDKFYQEKKDNKVVKEIDYIFNSWEDILK